MPKEKLDYTEDSLKVIDSDERIFRSWGSVEVVDRDGEVIPISELKRIMPVLIDRGGALLDGHSNRQVGRILNYEFKKHPSGRDGVLLTCKIYRNYNIDDIIWNDIKTGKKTGLSFGGNADKTRLDIRYQDIGGEREASILEAVEGYEFSVVDSPANQYATMTAINEVAKGTTKKEDQGDIMVEEKQKEETITPSDTKEEESRQEEILNAIESLTSRVAFLEEQVKTQEASEDKPDEDVIEDTQKEESEETPEEDKPEGTKPEEDKETKKDTEQITKLDKDIAELKKGLSEIKDTVFGFKKSMTPRTEFVKEEPSKETNPAMSIITKMRNGERV